MSIYLEWNDSEGFVNMWASVPWVLLIRVLVPAFSILNFIEATTEVLHQRRRRRVIREMNRRRRASSGGGSATPVPVTLTVAEVHVPET